MIIMPEQNAVFVGVPRTASMSMHRWLELGLRGGESSPFPIESLHSWHANLDEACRDSNYPLLTMWAFCVVRNPFDRLVSYCAAEDPFFAQDPRHSVLNALSEPVNRWTRPQIFFAKDIKQVFKFEELREAVLFLRKRLGISNEIEFPAFHETERPHYRACYTDEARELAEDRYAIDLNEFGYGF